MKLISKLRNSVKIKKILKVIVCLLLALYCFCVPSFGETTGILHYTIYISMILLTGFSFLYCFLYKDLKVHPYVFVLVSFVLVALVGTILYSHLYRDWLTLVLLLLSFFSFVYAFKTINSKLLILRIICFAFLLFNLYFCYIYRNELLNISSLASGNLRLGEYFDNVNGVAIFAMFGFAISLYLFLFDKLIFKLISILPCGLSFVVGISTGSRTFILMVVLFAFLFLFFRFKKHKIVFLLISILLISLIVIFLSLPMAATITKRLKEGVQTLLGTANRVDTSTVQRTVFIDYGFYLGQKNLIFGLGTFGFSVFSGVDTYSHCNYSEILCNFGIIGFVLYHASLILLLCSSFANKKCDKPLVISFIIYFLICGISNIFYYKKIYFLILALLYYLVYVEPVKENKNSALKKVKKILFTCDTMMAGGAEKVISVLSNEFIKNNIDVSIIAISDTKNDESFYPLNKKVKFRLLSTKKLNPVFRIKKLKKTIKEEKPDVVISFLPHVIIYTYFAISGLDIPFVVSERNDPRKTKFIQRILNKLIFRRANGCVFQTSDVRKYYSKETRLNSFVIPNPISHDYININKLSTKNEIVAVGRLEPQKDFEFLIKSLSFLNKNMNCSLKIYGSGTLFNGLNMLTKSLDLEKNVIFKGECSEWQKEISESSLFVLTSDYEGMPNALAEALLTGIQCLSVDCPVGGPRELAKYFKNCKLVEKTSPQNFALAIEECLINKQNYCINENPLNPTKISNKWISYLERVINYE